MKHDPLTPKRAAYEALRRSILLMELDPGSALDEAELGDHFGISRTPLREVIRQLAGEGYAVIVENRGAKVSDMSHMTLRDFFLAAPMIYAAVMRLAAENATPQQIDDLTAAQTVFRGALREEDVGARTLANDAFHRITGEMCRNVYLLPSFHRLLIDHARIGMTFFRHRGVGNARDLETAASQHDEMIAAIRTRDPDRAAELAVAHWTLSRKQIERFAMPAALSGTLGAQPLERE